MQDQKEPSVWSWIKQTIRAYWSRITLIVLVTAAAAFIQAAFPIFWQKLIDQAIAGTVDIGLAAILVGLFLVEVIPVIHVLCARFLNLFEYSTRYQLFKHALRLSVPFHKERESTKILLEANKGVGAGMRLLSLFLTGHLLADIPVAVFGLIYVAVYSLTAAGILVAFLLMFYYFSHWFGQRIAKIEEEYNERDNEVSARQREVLQQIETVKLHRAERQEQAWYQMHGRKVLELDNRLTNYYACFNFLGGLSRVLPFVVILVIFLPQIARGTLTIGTLMAMQIYIMRAVGPLGFLGDMYQELKTNAAKLKPALRILQQQPTIAEASRPIDMSPLRHQISFQGLSFRYPGSEDFILRNLSLTIAAGEKVAIVGRTGSGKTTLARLLVRFYDPDNGLITLDSTDLRHVSFDSLYREVCYVTQEVPVFSGTISENVSYGLSELNDEQLTIACVQASAGFVLQHPQGLKAKVGELGEKLSGGERQRLALARVFLRRPSVVILDEATASLDQMTEREVQAAFDRLLNMNGGTTMVVIAHRITTVRNADRIVVLSAGQVADVGTHAELLSRCELYQELCRGMAE